jgi:hypothetical protein
MPEKEKSRRLTVRQTVTLHAKVTGYESVDSEWEENTRLIDFSRQGARFTLTRSVETGQLLHLSFVMPGHLRAFDRNATQYKVWTVVCSARETTAIDSDLLSFEVGVALIGAAPPNSFIADPSRRYDLKPVPTRDGFWQVRERARR